MYENLKKLRQDHGMNQKEFGALFGVKLTTYAGYEVGTSDPRTSFWIAVADHFHVSTDYLLDQTDEPRGTKYADKSELEKKYAALDGHGRKIVDAVMEIERERAASSGAPAEIPKTRIIPLFAAAAGPGEPVDGVPFQDHEIPAWKRADFCVRVSGDSMEPELHDREIVFCVKREPEAGEIAVFMVNGFLLIKQFVPIPDGISLRSLNRERKRLDVDLHASGNDTVVLYGTALHGRLPIVV